MDKDLRERLKSLIESEQFDEAVSVLSSVETSRPLTAEELVLKGGYIQLSSGEGTPPLSEAEQCFLEALRQDQDWQTELLNESLEDMMESVFVVQHLREDEGGYEDVKFIGVYSSKERAEASVESHKNLPGFSGYADGFSIDEYKLDKDHWNEGFVDLSAEESLPEG